MAALSAIPLPIDRVKKAFTKRSAYDILAPRDLGCRMRHVFIGSVVLMLGAAPVLALDGPGRALVASDQLQISANAALVSALNGSVDTGFVMPYSGTVRVSWEIKSTSGQQVNSSVEVTHLSACHEFTTSTTYVTMTCDLRVARGMPVVIRADANDAGTKVALRNVRVHYDVIDSDGKAIVYERLPAPA